MDDLIEKCLLKEELDDYIDFTDDDGIPTDKALIDKDDLIWILERQLEKAIPIIQAELFKITDGILSDEAQLVFCQDTHDDYGDITVDGEMWDIDGLLKAQAAITRKDTIKEIEQMLGVVGISFDRENKCIKVMGHGEFTAYPSEREVWWASLE